jgi:Flp pilus assembly protein CpaB
VALTHGLIGADQLGQSWVASVDLNNGEPIARSEIARSGSNTGLGAMSIDVPADHAAGGSIVAGDRVDVIAADGSGGASYIAQGLRVLTVAPSGDGGLLGATVGDYWVEVAVDKATALRLTAAMGGTDSLTGIEVVRSDGEVNSPTERYSSKYGRPQGITQPATASTTTPPSR